MVAVTTTVYPEQDMRLAALIDQAQAVIRTLAEQSAADQRAYEEGFRDGFHSGVEVGRIGAEKAEEERAASVAALITKTTRVRTIEELNQLRGWTYPPEVLAKMRGRDRYPFPDRLCSRCDGRGFIAGGVA